LTPTRYRLLACFSHDARLRLGFAWHLRNAAARFCATDKPFLATVFDAAGTGFPAPENVALGGAPNTPGGDDGAARHESAVTHATGGAGGLARHGEAAEHTRASYTSNA
jgi:hypothetical protein